MVGGCVNGKLADELFQYKCILDEQKKVFLVNVTTLTNLRKIQFN